MQCFALREKTNQKCKKIKLNRLMTPKIYPGMLDTRIEYFAKNNSVFKIKNGNIQKFEDTDHPELEKIIESDPDLHHVLDLICDGKKQTMLKTLAHCRFGGLNYEADFKENGSAKHDYIDCPLRGNCVGENIICKSPEINGHPISEIELTILRACASDRKNTAIAQDLNLAEGTFNVTKTEIYKRIGVPTKQHLALTLVEEGLL